MGQTRKLRKGKVYKIHDNGGRPFQVAIQGSTVIISKLANPDDFEDDTYKEFRTMKADKIFIGKKSPKGGYDGLKPSQAEGNSILLKVGSNYVYIGHEIYEFKPVEGDTIVEYYSDIGNSDVPYPYAVGENYMYIMLDKKAVEKSYFDLKKNIYEQFYFETYAKDCMNGFGNKELCKDRKAMKERIDELHSKTKSLKSKQIHKRLY
jgi:hypothetical protein